MASTCCDHFRSFAPWTCWPTHSRLKAVTGSGGFLITKPIEFFRLTAVHHHADVSRLYWTSSSTNNCIDRIHNANVGIFYRPKAHTLLILFIICDSRQLSVFDYLKKFCSRILTVVCMFVFFHGDSTMLISLWAHNKHIVVI